MQDPFVVAFVVGVTPGKWARIWGERMSRPLELRPLPRDAALAALAALADGSAHVALVRLPEAGLAAADMPGTRPPEAGLAAADMPGTRPPEAGSPEACPPEACPPAARLPEEFSAIPLYTEAAVVVAPKDHPVTAFESVTLADLAAEVILGPAVLEPGGADGSGVAAVGEFSGGLPAEPDWAALIALVAANVGVAIVPQSVARALSRRDVAATPITGTPETRIALVWVSARQIAETEEFIGIVRGRTANSSRGAGESGSGGAASGSGSAGSGGAGAAGAGSAGAGSGAAAKAKASGSKSATPSRRDPRASRARRR